MYQFQNLSSKSDGNNSATLSIDTLISLKREDYRKTVSQLGMLALPRPPLSLPAQKQFAGARALLHTRLMYANHKPWRFNKHRSADRMLRYTRETIDREDSISPQLRERLSGRRKKEEENEK